MRAKAVRSGGVARLQSDAHERVGEDRTESAAQPFLAVVQRRLQQAGEVLPFVVGQPSLGQALRRAAQVLGDAHQPLTRQRPLDRPFAAGGQPGHEVQGVDVALVIDADFLQVVEQGGLDRPTALVGLVQQRRQVLQPFVGLAVAQFQGGLQAPRQPSQIVVGLVARRIFQSRRRDAGGAGAQDRRSHRVARLLRLVGADHQPAIIIVRFVGAGVGAHHRLRRVGQPRLGEQLGRIHIARQQGVDLVAVGQPRKVDRQQVGGEVAQLQVHRGELAVHGRLVGRGPAGQQAPLLIEHHADLREGAGTDVVDALADQRRRQPAVAHLLPQGTVDAGVKQPAPEGEQEGLAFLRRQGVRRRPGQQDHGGRQQPIRFEVQLILLDVAIEGRPINNVAFAMRHLLEEIGQLVLALDQALEHRATAPAPPPGPPLVTPAATRPIASTRSRLVLLLAAPPAPVLRLYSTKVYQTNDSRHIRLRVEIQLLIPDVPPWVH